jgi:flagellar hook-associated protein 3 FlgL
MRITNHSLSETVVRQIQQLASRQAKLQAQVATGQRIFQPEDDPSSVARVLDLTSEQRRIGQYLRNADRALAVSQASFSGLQQIKRLSDRATEIATLGSGALSASALSAYAAEIDQLLEQGLQLANSRLGPDYLFAGTAVGNPAFEAERNAAGRITAVSYLGNAERARIPLSEHAGVAAGTTGETNLVLRDFLDGLAALRDALQSGQSAAVTRIQADLVASEDHVVSALAEHGAVQTRIEANRAEQRDRAGSLENLISAESDADLPSTIVKLNQTQTAYEAALRSGASIMRLSLLDYLK